MDSVLRFEAIYAAYSPYVHRQLQRLGVQACDLDDVVQDTFVAVHRQLPGFEGRAAIQTWLHAICWRVAAGYHRRSRTRRQIIESREGVWSGGSRTPTTRCSRRCKTQQRLGSRELGSRAGETCWNMRHPSTASRFCRTC